MSVRDPGFRGGVYDGTVQAFDVRHLELGIVTALTAALAVAAIPRATPPSAPGMPGPSPEPIAERLPSFYGVRMYPAQPASDATAPAGCDARDVTTVIVRGRISALDPDTFATFHFRFADLPSRYTVTTGAKGAFEIRIAREELGDLDLCKLPMSGQRPARFQDESMTLQYEVAFER